MNRNIVVINVAGTVGKSTFAKHALVPQMPNAIRISVEDWNAGDGDTNGKQAYQINSKNFYPLAAQISTDTEQSFILDIGSSNCRAMIHHFGQLGLLCDQLHFFCIPTRAGSKERLDTLRTIQILIDDLGIAPEKIVVIAQAITDVSTFDAEFGDLFKAARELRVFCSDVPVLFNSVFDLVKGKSETVFSIVQDKPDFDALRSQFKGDEIKLMQLGEQMVLFSLAQTAVRNLMSVFESTPLAMAIREEEGSIA